METWCRIMRRPGRRISRASLVNGAMASNPYPRQKGRSMEISMLRPQPRHQAERLAAVRLAGARRADNFGPQHRLPHVFACQVGSACGYSLRGRRLRRAQRLTIGAVHAPAVGPASASGRQCFGKCGSVGPGLRPLGRSPFAAAQAFTPAQAFLGRQHGARTAICRTSERAGGRWT
ncbi:hypothetical protein SAMN05880570_0853 [Paenibacillus sp. RU4T]|nr:hypothetical protein SAMN05880555_0854 [Paenibacillus sp. RU4X]SIQ37679.1 hypothetical protein SAMN05880570_0853 [Paenibacillus sp. RU4T]